MNKTAYNQVAKQLNALLPFGQVTVISTRHIDPEYCDKWSLYLDDDVASMLHEQRDKTTIKAIYDHTFSTNEGQVYIEPYNSYLLNLARL